MTGCPVCNKSAKSIEKVATTFLRFACLVVGTLRKTRWQRQRQRPQTEGLMSTTIAVHVRYNSWYIFAVLCITTT